MTGEHFDDAELAAFDDGNATAEEVAAITAHLASCRECSDNLQDVRSLTALLRDPAVHLFSDRRRTRPAPSRIADAQAVFRRREQERQHAETTFAELMTRPLDAWLPYLEEQPERQTEALVERIIAEARTEYDRRAGFALDLLGIATPIANALPDVKVLALQRATIAKERANAFRMLSRYREALDELDTAERFLTHVPVHAVDLALVEWGRATVLFAVGRFPEALPLVRRAAKVLRQFGDTPRAQQATVLEAGILFEVGQIDAALRLNRRLASYFAETGETMTLARVTANIAACETSRDRVEDAQSCAAEAMRLYDGLGMETEKVRLDFLLGTLAKRRGRAAEARQRLLQSASAFRALGMRMEAGEALLHVVELDVAEQAWTTAIPRARELATLFSDVGAPVHAAQAYEALRTAVEAQRATVELIEYVRQYVGDRRTSISDFSPPA